MANPTLDEIASNLVASWRNSEFKTYEELRQMIANALKQRDSKVIASVTDALSKVLYER